MNGATVMLSVIAVAMVVVTVALVWGIIEMVKTARSMRVLADDLDTKLIPLVEKTDVTVDAMNVELLRVDAIITRVEEVTSRVESTSRVVHEAATVPGEIVNDIAERVRRAWKRRSAETPESAAARRHEDAGDASDKRGAPTAVSDTAGKDETT